MKLQTGGSMKKGQRNRNQKDRTGRQQNQSYRKNQKREPERLVRDLNSRTVFGNSVLCAQFLRDYVDIEQLKNVQPEDIEDVSQKYQAYLGVSFETDSVKKIRIRNTETDTDVPLYLISLIEHKSQVDYNVSMQLLRYMVCIWNEYGKEMEQEMKGNASNKGFKYPPILPVVYYEGTKQWTAGFHLRDRIMMYEVFKDYLPDFTYKLVRNHDYTNEELLDNKDEMSLLMMINKVQVPEDMEVFLDSQKEKMNQIVAEASEPVLEIICSAVWGLCMKMNIPQEEAEQYVGKVKERRMGYWFENVTIDIQAERRKAKEERIEAEKERRAAKEEARAEREAAKEEAQAEREAAKEEAQAEREAAKEEAQAEREAAKEEARVVREAAEEEAKAVREAAEEEAKAVREAAEEEARAVKEAAEKKAKAIREAAKKDAKGVNETAKEGLVKIMVSLCQEYQETKETVIQKVMEECSMTRQEAGQKVDIYWKI